MAFPFLATVFKLFISLKVRRYISGICPKGRMAAIGKYRRNLIDFEENSRYILFWAIYTSSVVALRKTAVMFPDISPVTIYRIGHGNALVFLWLFHGLLLPLSMKIAWKTKQPRKASPFYVREPLLPLMDLPLPPHPPPSTTPPRTTTPNSVQTSERDWFRSPSPISPPIRQSLNWPQQEHSHAIGEENMLKTLYYSSSLYRPAKQEATWSKEMKGIVGVNAVLTTALTFQRTGATSPEKYINLKPFKCEICNYECETNITLQKHKNTRHGVLDNETGQKHDMQEAPSTPNSSHSSRNCGHGERKATLKTTDTKDPRNRWYQIRIRYKRQRQTSPLNVHNHDVLSVHSPATQHPVPASPVQTTRDRQDVAVSTEGNTNTSQRTGKYYGVTSTNSVQCIGNETSKTYLPSVE